MITARVASGDVANAPVILRPTVMDTPAQAEFIEVPPRALHQPSPHLDTCLSRCSEL